MRSHRLHQRLNDIEKAIEVIEEHIVEIKDRLYQLEELDPLEEDNSFGLDDVLDVGVPLLKTLNKLT